MLNKQQNVKECDATDDANSTKARLISQFQKFLIPNSQFQTLSLTFAALKLFIHKNRDNEQLRIDGDFYPCAF